jgi:hypothetical protein
MWLDTEHPVTLDALRPGDVIHDRHGKVEGEHWHHVVVRAVAKGVHTISNNNNLGWIDACDLVHYYRLHPRGHRAECRAARRGGYDCRFGDLRPTLVYNGPAPTTLNFADALKEHFNPSSEGWHAIYKHYGGAVLARENYRWKRKIMARFGPNRAMESRISWHRQMNAPSMFDNPIFKGLKPWKGGSIEVPFR